MNIEYCAEVLEKLKFSVTSVVLCVQIYIPYYI